MVMGNSSNAKESDTVFATNTFDSATAESAKTLTGPVTVNNANKIATRLVNIAFWAMIVHRPYRQK